MMGAKSAGTVPPDMIPDVYKQPWVNDVQLLIHQGNQTGERTTCWENIQLVLVEKGVAQREVQILPEFCGVSPL